MLHILLWVARRAGMSNGRIMSSLADRQKAKKDFETATGRKESSGWSSCKPRARPCTAEDCHPDP
jgi:hypothetical protein